MSQDTILTATSYGGGRERSPFDDDDDTLHGAPNVYEPFNVPENIHVEPGLHDRFVGMAQSLNLSQRGAQHLIDAHLSALDCQNHAHQDHHYRTRENWRSECQCDTEIGGPQMAANLARAREVMRTFGSPALRELLDESGLGDHPEVVRFFVRIGKAVGEGNYVAGSGGVSKPLTPAQKLYPNMNN